MPVSAEFTTGPIVITMTYDQPLILDPSSSGTGWSSKISSNAYGNPTMAILSGGRVRLTGWASLGPNVPPDRVSYSNPLGEVRGISGLPVAPMVDFPLT